MKQRLLKYSSSLFMLLFLNGCSGLSVADSDTPRTYLLDIPLPSVPSTYLHSKTLLVSIPQAAPGFNTPALIYLRSPYVIEYYSKSQWVDTPARMLLPLLVHRLEATGLFSAVLSAATSPVAGELRLDTEILRLQQEFLTEPSQIRLVLRVQLLDMVARQVIATQVFEIEENTPSEDAEGGVLATNQAVARVLDELALFIKKQLQEYIN